MSSDYLRLKSIDETLVTSSSDGSYALRSGLNSSASNIHLSGYNDTVDGTARPMSSSISAVDFFLNPNLANLEWFVVSSSVQDHIAGTGATSVTVEFSSLTSSKTSVTVDMNGITPVSLGNQLNPLNCIVESVGATGNNEGILRITTTVGTTETALTVEIGENKSYQCHYQPSLGEKLYIDNFNLTSDIAGTDFAALQLWERDVTRQLNYLENKATVGPGVNTPFNLSNMKTIDHPNYIYVLVQLASGSGPNVVSLDLTALIEQ
jgi:hypothetical protein